MGKLHPIPLAVFVLLTLCLFTPATARADTITFSVTGTGISVPTAPPTPTNIDFSFNAAYDTPLGALSIAASGSVNLTVVTPTVLTRTRELSPLVYRAEILSLDFRRPIQQAPGEGDTPTSSYTILSVPDSRRGEGDGTLLVSAWYYLATTTD